jgi:biopolymer transport protein TolQ
VPFLATTTSITPFIGLFGTGHRDHAGVHADRREGSTSLAVVAPGIAEALIRDGRGSVRGGAGGRISITTSPTR